MLTFSGPVIYEKTSLSKIKGKDKLQQPKQYHIAPNYIPNEMLHNPATPCS